jgi:hypothetical protein
VFLGLCHLLPPGLADLGLEDGFRGTQCLLGRVADARSVQTLQPTEQSLLGHVGVHGGRRSQVSVAHQLVDHAIVGERGDDQIR